MQTRIFDLFLGLCIGFYITPTITVSGVTVPWALVGLGISILIPLLKKLCQLCWTKFIQAIKAELSKDTI